MVSKDEAIVALKKVIDPELDIDLWTLELIYEINIAGKDVEIVMTLTSPMCPFGPILIQQVKEALEQAGFNNVDVKLTFDPPWEPSEDVKMELGLL